MRDTEADISGSFYSDEGPATYHFEYGTTTAYGTMTPTRGPAASGNPIETISGLSPDTTYHYRFVATNNSGTTFGNGAQLVTPPAPAAPDDDHDGVRGDEDLCPTYGNDPEHPNWDIQADGCPPTLVQFGIGSVSSISSFARDRPWSVGATCYFRRGQKCVVHATVTLSRGTAKAARIGKRLISNLTIPLTDEAPDPHRVGPPPVSHVVPNRLRLSSAVRKKLRKLKSATMTMRATYTLGSHAPVVIGSNTFTVPYKSSKPSLLINHPHQDDFVCKFDCGPAGEG